MNKNKYEDMNLWRKIFLQFINETKISLQSSNPKSFLLSSNFFFTEEKTELSNNFTFINQR
jgi:hypothetical protein